LLANLLDSLEFGAVIFKGRTELFNLFLKLNRENPQNVRQQAMNK